MKTQIKRSEDCYSFEDLHGETPVQIAYKKGSRYILGTEQLEIYEMKAIEEDPDTAWLPVYAYVHGDATISTEPFACTWDSGRSGIAYCDKAALSKEFPSQEPLDVLRSTVKQFDLLLTGDVWDIQLLNDDDEVVDHVCGYLGREWAEEAAKEMLNAH